MPFYKDQLGREIAMADIPARIISLVPSQTELLAELALDEQVAGITKFCIHPERWFRTKARVGGTKTVNIERLLSLNPDLIIANKEENTKDQIARLEERVPVWVSDVNNLEDAYDMILGIGRITGTLSRAEHIVTEIRNSFKELIPASLLPAAYLIWKDPYMTVGGDTFISDMLKHCGFQNVFADMDRYPAISLDQIAASGCRIVLLSSEPYPFKEKHLHEISNTLPGIKVFLVDGEFFSWYGSRLLKAPAYFNNLIERVYATLNNP